MPGCVAKHDWHAWQTGTKLIIPISECFFLCLYTLIYMTFLTQWLRVIQDTSTCTRMYLDLIIEHLAALTKTCSELLRRDTFNDCQEMLVKIAINHWTKWTICTPRTKSVDLHMKLMSLNMLASRSYNALVDSLTEWGKPRNRHPWTSSTDVNRYNTRSTHSTGSKN